MFRIAGSILCVALLVVAGCSSNDTPTIAVHTDDGGAEEVTPTIQPTLAGSTIDKFVDEVPTFAGRRVDGRESVSVNMFEFQQKMLPASFYEHLPAPYDAGTFLWGYALNGAQPSYPASTIEVVQGTATTVTYANGLSNADGSPLFLQHRLITDLTIHWADPSHASHLGGCMNGPPLPANCLATNLGPVPAVVHLHGGQVAPAFDGMPETWFTPRLALKGPAYETNTYTYPNRQDATTLWYHDHALGITRLNVYAGLAGFYLIRDASDTGTANNPMDLPAGAYEAELLVADRQFDVNGQLYFPAGLPGSGPGLNGGPPNSDHHPYWIPEFFGDVVVVNGKSWPVMHVEPRRYRFRFVNGSNARFWQMQLFAANNGVPTDTAGPSIWQIASDGGFLNAPVNLDANPIPGIFIAPAERADVIVDFGGQSGQTFILTNGHGCGSSPDRCGAFAPFPSGDPPDPETTGQVMMFSVDEPLSGTDTTFNPAAAGLTLRGGASQPPAIVDIKTTTPNVRRQLVLVEIEGQGGPEEILLNNSKWTGVRENLTPDVAPEPIPDSTSNGHGTLATEVPQVGSTEIWELANVTMDAHPIHLHLVQFQVIDRETMVANDDGETAYEAAWDAAFPGGTFSGQTYDPGTMIPGYGPPLPYATPNADGAVGGNPAFGGAGFLTGMITPPDPNEAGWKDTVKVPPMTVTRLAVRFAPQRTPVADVSAGQNLYSFDPTAEPGYEWHCHLLDHEDNEMMRLMLLRK
jgi:FtsP/CotA-like multicopper oxidase with cupredoxin domain